MLRFGVTKQILDKYKQLIPYTNVPTDDLQVDYNQVLDSLIDDTFHVYDIHAIIRTQNIELIEEIFGDIIQNKLHLQYDEDYDWYSLLRVFITIYKFIKPVFDNDTYEEIIDQFSNSFYYQLKDALETNDYFKHDATKYIPVSSLQDLINSLSDVEATINKCKHARPR